MLKEHKYIAGHVYNMISYCHSNALEFQVQVMQPLGATTNTACPWQGFPMR